MKKPVTAGAVFLCLFFLYRSLGYCQHVDTLTFSWDASDSGGQITGYKLCLGGTSRGAVIDYTAFRYDQEFDAGTKTQYTVAGLSGYTSFIYASVVAYSNAQISSYSTEVSWNNTPSTTSSGWPSTSSTLSTTTTSIIITQPATTSSIPLTTLPETTSSSSTSAIVAGTTTSATVATTTQPIDKPHSLKFRWNKR